MASLDFSKLSHRRYNPLLGEWVLVSPDRLTRPWQGQHESPAQRYSTAPQNNEKCYLCPGNYRANGTQNPIYKNTFVFDNDFPALNNLASENAESDCSFTDNITEKKQSEIDNPLFKSRQERGCCKVVCYSPDHQKTFAELTLAQIRQVVECWQCECEELSKEFKWIQIFENKGELMGSSNPHPHGQIWAQENLPSIAQRKQQQFTHYTHRYNINLLLDYANREGELKERLVCENESWLAVVPFWAAWPFETLVLSKTPLQHFTSMTDNQKTSLATLLKELTIRYDNVFNCSFPYTMGWHGAPFDNDAHPEWNLHAHFYPPLLRSAAIRKFMVGYEMLAESQRDITPEVAAKCLRETSIIHYKHQ